MSEPLPIPPAGLGRRRLLFEDFELRLDSGELLQAGAPVKLQPQPAKILEILACRSGEVVSRDEIRQLVWGDAFVDLDASLNFCIKEIRRALGDSATSPRFVETVPRRGYRFLMPVRRGEEPARELAAPPVARPAAMPVPPPRRWSGWGAAGLAVALLSLLFLLVASRLHPRPPTPRTSSPSARANQAYGQGLYFKEREKFEEADARFRDAILLDPEFAAAHAQLALNQLKWINKPVDPEVTETAAQRAVDLDPDLAEGHAALGQILLQRYLDWDRAGRELRKALALDPASADAHFAYSQYLQGLGKDAEAISEVQRARELDPPSMIVGANYAWYLYLDHQYQEAIREARAVQALFPASSGKTPMDATQGLLIAHDTILNSSLMLGDQETALATAKAFTRDLGRPEEAEQIRKLDDFWRGRQNRIDAATQTMAIDSYIPAKNAMVMGDPERALSLLSRCAAKDTLAFPFAAVEPLFDRLHDDPRWQKVLDCLKLPADAPARHRNR